MFSVIKKLQQLLTAPDVQQLQQDKRAIVQKLMACSAKRKAERRRERVLLSCCDYVLQSYTLQAVSINEAMQALAKELQVYSNTDRPCFGCKGQDSEIVHYNINNHTQ